MDRIHRILRQRLQCPPSNTVNLCLGRPHSRQVYRRRPCTLRSTATGYRRDSDRKRDRRRRKAARTPMAHVSPPRAPTCRTDKPRHPDTRRGTGHRSRRPLALSNSRRPRRLLGDTPSTRMGTQRALLVPVLRYVRASLLRTTQCWSTLPLPPTGRTPYPSVEFRIHLSAAGRRECRPAACVYQIPYILDVRT